VVLLQVGSLGLFACQYICCYHHSVCIGQKAYLKKAAQYN
jgi:hypothetical protein